MRAISSRLPDCQPVAEHLTNHDLASQLRTGAAAVRVSVQPVAWDVSHEAVRRAVPVVLEFWLVADLAAEVPDSELPNVSEPEAGGHESVQVDQ